MSVLCHHRRLNKPRHEVADVLNRYLDGYLSRHKLSVLQHKVIAAIQYCRTAMLGGHKWTCDSCDYERAEYNSCRNRHCPKCQISNMMKWVSERLSELLPIPYYHSIFTMPHSLNPVALYNKEVIYDIFFKAVSHALNSFAQDPRFLGAKLGFIGILHTWGQAITHHVHLHLIVTGGGISNDGTRWVNLPYRKKFLFPVVAVSKRVRKRFAELLLKAYEQDKLVFPEELAHLRQPEVFDAFLNKVAWQNWNCYVKEPFASPESVLKYIGRYTHRVAIANQRLLDIEDDKVTFRYKKYKDRRVYHRIMTLAADEFIRRFLLHIIPRGFKRIRHFGFMAPGCRGHSIELAQKLLSERVAKIAQTTSDLQSWFSEFDTRKCPVCQTGTLSLSVVGPMIFKPG